MATVVAKDTCRVAGSRELIVKNQAYDDKDPRVLANPGLFETPDDAALRQTLPKSTDELGELSMSARKVERATKAPGETRDVALTCDECGFEAASPAGLGAHRRTHG